MANNPSAAKRARQSLQRRIRNRSRRTAARTATRRVREVALTGDAETYEAALQRAYSLWDRAAKNGAIHSRTADRYKRRLAALRDKVEAGS